MLELCLQIVPQVFFTLSIRTVTFIDLHHLSPMDNGSTEWVARAHLFLQLQEDRQSPGFLPASPALPRSRTITSFVVLLPSSLASFHDPSADCCFSLWGKEQLACGGWEPIYGEICHPWGLWLSLERITTMEEMLTSGDPWHSGLTAPARGSKVKVREAHTSGTPERYFLLFISNKTSNGNNLLHSCAGHTAEYFTYIVWLTSPSEAVFL